MNRFSFPCGALGRGREGDTPMDIHIHWKAVAHHSQAIEEYLAQRLRRTMERFVDHVTVVHAWLEDVDGAHGGFDKRCALEVHGGLGLIRAEVHDTDFYDAVDRVAVALGRMVRRPAVHRRA